MQTVPTPEERQRIPSKIEAGLRSPVDDGTVEAAYERLQQALARKAARRLADGAQ